MLPSAGRGGQGDAQVRAHTAGSKAADGTGLLHLHSFTGSGSGSACSRV